MKLNLSPCLFLIFLMLPTQTMTKKIVPGHSDLCTVIDKEITKYRNQFNAPDEIILKQYKEKLKKDIDIKKNYISSLKKTLLKPDQVIKRAREVRETIRKGLHENINSLKQYLAKPNAIILQDEKNELQGIIEMLGYNLNQNYLKQLYKPNQKIKSDISSLKKQLKETLDLQLLPDNVLLKKTKNDIQAHINILKHRAEKKKKVRSDKEILEREQKRTAKELKIQQELLPQKEEALRQPDHILLQKAKSRIQDTFLNAMNRMPLDCLVD